MDLTEGFYGKTSFIGKKLERPNSRSFRGFKLEQQQQSNWCWASIVQGQRINARRGPPWSQSAVAAMVLGMTDCVLKPGSYNNPLPLYAYLQTHGAVDLVRDAPYDEGRIMRVVDGRTTALCLIDRGNGLYHYVLVVGWHVKETRLVLHVCDPSYGGKRRCVDYSELCLSYRRTQGSWIGTGRLG